LNTKNYEFLLNEVNIFINYISNLKDNLGQPILNTARKICFLRLIVCLTNIFELFNILRSKGQEYLLTYKISQAFFEMFFSSGGGWNNNPNAFQFQNGYRRLLFASLIMAIVFLMALTFYTLVQNVRVIAKQFSILRFP
jgi:hypothetical protein